MYVPTFGLVYYCISIDIHVETPLDVHGHYQLKTDYIPEYTCACTEHAQTCFLVFIPKKCRTATTYTVLMYCSVCVL